MARKAKVTAPAEKAATKSSTSAEDRAALNDRARFDYGIMNADTMTEAQVKQEIKQVDDQVKAGQAENEAAKKAESDNA